MSSTLTKRLAKQIGAKWLAYYRAPIWRKDRIAREIVALKSRWAQSRKEAR